MIWAAGGISLWLGGWWFTGRLVDVYQKAIYLEEADRRHRGLGPSGEQHHRGMALFVLFDLGLLVLGIRSLATLHAGGDEVLVDSSIAENATKWSVLGCLYLFRQGSNIHGFYHARWRARTGLAAVKPRNAGTLRGIWEETSPTDSPYTRGARHIFERIAKFLPRQGVHHSIPERISLLPGERIRKMARQCLRPDGLD